MWGFFSDKQYVKAGHSSPAVQSPFRYVPELPYPELGSCGPIQMQIWPIKQQMRGRGSDLSQYSALQILQIQPPSPHAAALGVTEKTMCCKGPTKANPS